MQPINSVLLIDDEPVFNMINERVIQMAKYSPKVSSFIDAGKALDELRLLAPEINRFPDFIFLDVNMPLMDGWGFLDELNKFPELIQQKCKVIMLSSSIDKFDIDKSKDYKMVSRFISKPLSVAQFELLCSPHYQSTKSNN